MSTSIPSKRTIWSPAAATLLLLIGLNLLNYIDRYILPGEVSLIQREFHSTDQQMGWLTTALFLTYMLVAPMSGWLGDRFRRKPLIVTGAVLWSLATLATTGSTSPYVGLFGTVWGIMSAFYSLGNVQQATLAMVAPGISEALITTAFGLFAAIPAVIAYNRFADQVARLEIRFDAFTEEFSTILQRHAARGAGHSGVVSAGSPT